MATLTDSFGDKPRLVTFVWRRLSEAAGAAFLVASFLLILGLASYNHGDPSWNHAATGIPTNILGPAGAYGADILIQGFGLAAALLPLTMLAWAFRLLLNRGLALLWLRLLLLPPTLVTAATALAVIPAPAMWPTLAGLGGAVGSVILGTAARLSHLPPPIIAMGAAAFAGFLMVLVLALSMSDLRDIGRGTRGAARVARWGGVAAYRTGRAAGRTFGRLGRRRDEDDEPRMHGRRTSEAGAEPGQDAAPPPRRGWFQRVAAASAAADGPPLRREPRLDAVRQSFAPGWEVGSATGESASETRAETAPENAETAPTERRRRRELPPDLVAPKPVAARRLEPARQAMLDLEPESEHVLPTLDLLRTPPPTRAAAVNEEALQQNARLLETVLEDFGVRGQIVKVRPGPVVTLYELEPAPGIKASRIIGLADDIARSMSAVSVRVAVIPGRNVIGIELPNTQSETVYLRELLASEAYERNQVRLALVLGKDIGGAPVIADLARMPHLLIAGTTGSGKSVGINTMILSILYRLPPDQCKFIMIDPKMLELSIYDGIPHLLTPVVTEPRKAVVALKWTVREMETRYRAMSKLGVRNIEGYNARLAESRAKGEPLLRRVQTGFDAETGQPVFEEQPLDTKPLPLIVVVVDEMADLMLVAGKDIEAAIQRLAQMARAAGIHIIMATQRPSVDVITGTIKANFPTRISFQVTSKIDSRTILGESGAEQLLGRGDMLYMAGGGRITRVHGPFVGDQEVEAVVRFLKENGGDPIYIDEITAEDESAGEGGAVEGGEGGGSDQLYDQAVALVCRERKASTSFIQRHLQIGYNRAARIIERMEVEGVVSTANHVGKREVLARNIE
jgi:S-DNA-T family DNA segregation ATPase FtsK/SpoIIIE